MTASGAGVPPILVFGWGNPSRGDDALGQMFIEQAAAITGSAASCGVEYLTDFQLQVEHALDLVGREQVLFVDASLDAAPPYQVSRLHAAAERHLSSHALAPSALLQVFERLHGRPAPPCTLLAIRGSQFELGEPLGADAAANLADALTWYPGWLAGARTDPTAATAAPCTS
jgi:hydrogenase maturation protease